MFSKRNYQIVIVDKSTGRVDNPTQTLEQLLKSSNEEPEYKYAIQENFIDELLDLKQGQHLVFEPSRDDKEAVGLIVRIV